MIPLSKCFLFRVTHFKDKFLTRIALCYGGLWYASACEIGTFLVFTEDLGVSTGGRQQSLYHRSPSPVKDLTGRRRL